MVSFAAEFGHLSQSGVRPFVGGGCLGQQSCFVMEIMAFLPHSLPESTELLEEHKPKGAIRKQVSELGIT